MIGLITAYLATLVSVGLKATQNLNVFHRRMGLIIPVSTGLAVVDYFLVNAIVTQGPWIIVACGLGGATGCWLSIAHDRWYSRTHKEHA